VTARRKAVFLRAAEQDLVRLGQDDPDLPRLALGKIRDLESGAVEGERLHEMAATGDLSECRKLYFGKGSPPTHRIVYRDLQDGGVEVLEIIAIEARQDLYAYLLAAVRLGRLPPESDRRYTRVHQEVIKRRSARRTRRS